MNSEEEIGLILQKLEHVHYPCGPVYQDVCKKQALLNLDKNELEGIYYLKESHAPGLRSKAVYRYIKNAASGDAISLNKNCVDFNCNKSAGHDNISRMLQEVWEMPKEWTLVQITAKSDRLENIQLVRDKPFTNDLHISVFQCGGDQHYPFCVTVPAPIDKITNSVMDIKGEMLSIIRDNKSVLNITKGPFNSALEKKQYIATRSNLNNRLRNLVKDIQNYWLAEWRCLLMGKLFDKSEQKVGEVLESILSGVNKYKISAKIKSILTCLIRASNHLKLIEVKKVVQYCFPDDRVVVTRISKIIDDFSRDNNTFFAELKAHPVILVLDEKLDIFPWETIDILLNHPVSRIPSLHFTYALFKQYENRIKKGMLVAIDANKGKYIINPDLDLTHMERRISNFLHYRIPSWSGLVHVRPGPGDMEKCIVESDIFSYYGHGNGSQFLASDRIQKLSVKSVVCLFGCSSSSYIELGPQVEMYGAHLMYLLACSPCVVGALWVVTDNDTDVLSTEFFNFWLPPNNFKWKDVDKKLWETTGKIEVKKTPIGQPVSKPDIHEPELLRALSKAKKCVSQYLTQAGFIARGLPVSV